MVIRRRGGYRTETTRDSDLRRGHQSEENRWSMTRTKQKARLSTGGKAPRKQIGMLAARKTTSHRICLLIKFVGFWGSGKSVWVVQWSYSTGREFN